MLFGPSGAGKSSLVKSLLMSYENKISKGQQLKDLVIPTKKGDNSTEKFTRIVLRKPSKFIDKHKNIQTSTGIHLVDTKGQVLLNQNEVE